MNNTLINTTAAAVKNIEENASALEVITTARIAATAQCCPFTIEEMIHSIQNDIEMARCRTCQERNDLTEALCDAAGEVTLAMRKLRETAESIDRQYR